MAWNWNNDSGYVAFDSTTNGIIEAAYAAGQSNVTLTHGFFAKDTYVIDFNTLKQKNSRTNFERDVQRIASGNSPRGWLPCKGAVSSGSGVTRTQTGARGSRSDSGSGSGSGSDFVATPSLVRASVSFTSTSTSSAPLASSTSNDDDDDETYKWQYSDLSSGWADYDDTAQNIIETAWRAGQNTCNLNHGFFARDGYQLTIQGTSLTQRNLKTNNSRSIRRDPPTRSTKSTSTSTSSTPAPTTIAPQKKIFGLAPIGGQPNPGAGSRGSLPPTAVAIQVNPNLARGGSAGRKAEEEKGKAKPRSRSPSPESSDEETRKKRRGIVPVPATPVPAAAVAKTLAQQFSDGLTETFNNPKFFPDVKFVFKDGKELLAHKVILSARKIAGAFDLEKYYESKAPLVFIDDFSFAEFELFMRAIYTGKCFVTSKELCQGLSKVAKVYQHAQIHDSCEMAIKGGIFPCYISYHAILALPEKACLPDYSDCDLLVSGARIPAHRVILCANSNYFRGMFMRGMKEAENREAVISEPWDPATFAAFLKSLYCFDFQVSLEPVKMFPRATIDVQQFMEMADMYNVSAMHEECVKSLSSNLDELGLDVNSVVFLFNFMSRPSVRVKFDTSQWGSEQFVFKPLVGPLRPCVMIAKDVQAQKYWIGDQDVGVFSVSESVFPNPVTAKVPTVNVAQYFIPYNETEKRLFTYLLDHADQAASSDPADLQEWPDYLIDGLLLYIAAEKTRATKRPWDMMQLAAFFKRNWAFAAFQLICQELISVPTVTSIISAAHKCQATSLKQKCLEYINAHMVDIAEMYQNHPSLSSPSLKSVSKLSVSMASSIHNQIRVGTVKKYANKCDLCLKSLKGLKTKKVICPVCKGSMCEDCISSEVIVLPDVFNISEAVAACLLCTKIVRATYDIDEFVKYDPRLKAWLIPDSDFDVKRHFQKDLQTRFYKAVFEVGEAKCDLSIIKVACENLAGKDVGKTSDPYYTVTTAGSNREVFKSNKILKDVNPVWSKEENLLGLNWSEDLIFTFFDWDRIGKHTFIGSARISPMALHILAEEKGSDAVRIKFARLNQVNPLKEKAKRDEKITGSAEFHFTIFANTTKQGKADDGGKKVQIAST